MSSLIGDLLPSPPPTRADNNHDNVHRIISSDLLSVPDISPKFNHRIKPSLTQLFDSNQTTTTNNNNNEPIRRKLGCSTTSGDEAVQPGSMKKREVFRFQTDWLVSSVAWSNEPGESFRLALCSYIEDYKNKIQLVTLAKDDYDKEIEATTSFEHPYPPTKILWIPRPTDSLTRLPQLIATTADYLRLWRVEKAQQQQLNSRRNGDSTSSSLIECDSTSSRPDTEVVKLECLLNSNKGMKHCAPLTSFDWNDVDPSIIVTASVDTTCAIWDIEIGRQIGDMAIGSGGQSGLISPVTTKMAASDDNSYCSKVSCNLRNQVLAHDHEVYDVSFSRSGTGRDVFASSGGDGSVRLFDLRRLSKSTMVYEVPRSTTPNECKALVRVCCNKQNANYLSTFATNSKDILILDLRNPGRPVAVLSSHTAELNSMSWAPHSAHHICTASNDHQALIWELSKLPSTVDEPLLAYRANGKINAINWSASHPDWIAIGFENYLELLRV